MNWQWPGSRWWRVDFHAHTPSSHDFQASSQGQAVSWEDWLAAVSSRDIDAVVVTDHNSNAAVDAIAAVRAGMTDGPAVIPGLEITASDGTHLLFVFDPTCSGRHVGELLTMANIPVDHWGDRTARSPLSVEALLQLQPTRGAVVIAAHANGEAGLLAHDGMQRLTELGHPNLAAVEVTPAVALDATWIDGSKPQAPRIVPRVHGSDAHRLSELGRRFTWVKMTSPTLDGLRLAMLDGQDSLLPAVAADRDDPNRHADAAIESITVEQAKFMGRPEPFVLTFNPWLNAIIGGRGTGKSTLVDLLRCVLRRETDLGQATDGSGRQAFGARMRVSTGRNDEGLLLDDTTVTLIYRKDGQRYRLTWKQGGTPDPIAHLADGGETLEEGDIRERFPVRIYSQKQLFEMAQNPASLLEVVDSSPEVQGTEMRRRLAASEARYLSLRAEARSLHSQAAALPDRRAALLDLQRKLQVLNTGEHAETFTRYASYSLNDRNWSDAVSGAQSAVEELRRTATTLSVADLDCPADTATDVAVRALSGAHAELRSIVQTLRDDVVEVTDTALARMAALRAGADVGAWSTAMAAVTAAYDRAAEQLAAVGIESPAQHRALIQQSAALEDEIAALEGHRDAAAQRELDARNELAQYRAVHADRDRLRTAFCASRRTDQLRLSARIVDGAVLSEWLTGALHQALGIDRFDNDIAAIAARVLGEDGQWDFDRLDAEVATLERAVAADGQGPWLDPRFGPALARVSPERLDRLRLLLPPQTVDVDRWDNGSWRVLSQGSPGQQTAALLSFVLSYGDEPIILDQPEDDLDSTLIYDLVVQQVRSSKARRQVIVVTHNANIVVHGDAEAITVLEAAGGQTRIRFQGGLQEPLARKEVCEVLEGGREVFERRYRRIAEGSRSV